MSDAKQALVQRFYDEVISGGNVDALDELMAPDFTDHPPIGMPGPPGGREGFKQFVAALRGAFPDFRWTVDQWIVAEDKVVARGMGRGTHRGDFMGIPPTGQPAEWSAIHIFRVRDGRFTDRWGEANIGGLAERLRAPEP